jgi:hypothetical protein
MNRVKKFLKDCIVSDNGKVFRVSEKKLQEKMPNLSAAEVKKITDILSAYLGTSGFQNSRGMEGLAYDTLVESWKDSASYYLEAIRAYALDLVQKLGPFVKTRIDFNLLDRMVKRENLSATEKLEATKVLVMVYRLGGMIDESVQSVVAPLDISTKSAAKSLEWDEKSKKFNLFIVAPEQIKIQRDAVLKICRTAIAKSLAATPSALRQRKATELLEKVKFSALAVAPEYFSGNTLKTVENSIQTVKFTIPKNAQEVKETNQAALNEAHRVFERTQALMDKADVDPLIQQSVGLFALTEASSEVEKVFQSVQDTCEKIAPPSFEDAALWFVGKVRSGWQSNMFPEIGVGVLAHELGHIASFAIKNESNGQELYQATRTCSASVHAQLARSSDVNAFKQFAEEDWADSFAISTLKHLQKSWPYAENFACPLIELDDKSSEMPYKELELFDERNFDTHSTSFLRALQVHVALGKTLPKSCTSAMSENETAAVGKVCGK